MIMLFALCVSLALSPTPLDTTVTFGVVRRDVTGDTIPEVLTLTGTGRTVESLLVTFTIASSGQTLHSQSWRLTPASFDSQRRISATEYHERLGEYGGWFFAESRFMSPQAFLSWLEASTRRRVPLIPAVIARNMTPNDTVRARRIWDQMQRADITVFQFSPGGDRIQFIGWSPIERRFYDLVECC